MRIIRRYLLPAISLTLVAYALSHVVQKHPRVEAMSPPLAPVCPPFQESIGGTGTIEPHTEAIAVGTALPGIAVEVLATVGERVRQGDALFRLDDRELQAELAVRQASRDLAAMRLRKLEQMPRAEEIPLTEARQRAAEAGLELRRDAFQRTRDLRPKGAVSEQELVAAEQSLRMAEQQLSLANAEHRLLRAGAWDADLALARSEIQLADAQVKQTEAEIERRTVRAPLSAVVLKVNVRRGEYLAVTGALPAVLLGDLDRLHVRVELAAQEIGRFKTEAAVFASPRGEPRRRQPLTFVRIEPCVVPKRQLTGSPAEQIDTRVLQVVYALQDPLAGLFAGQQMEVFIQVTPNENDHGQ